MNIGFILRVLGACFIAGKVVELMGSDEWIGWIIVLVPFLIYEAFAYWIDGQLNGRRK